jgi:hypothetical protein
MVSKPVSGPHARSPRRLTIDAELRRAFLGAMPRSAMMPICIKNIAFSGDFTPVLAKHSKSFSLIDCISVGVDRMQRNFEPMRKQVEG